MGALHAVGKHAVRKPLVAHEVPEGQVPASAPSHFTVQAPLTQAPPGQVAPQRPQLFGPVV